MESKKSWLDLTDKEKAELQVEFSYKFKHKIPDLRIILYSLSFLNFAVMMAVTSSKNAGNCTTQSCSDRIGFTCFWWLIFLILAIINSELISKRKKKFIKWLETKNIIK